MSTIVCGDSARLRRRMPGHAIAAVFVLLLPILVLHASDSQTWLQGAGRALSGQAAHDRSDLLQDVVGAQALRQGSNPYPDLGPAIARLGVSWSLPARSYSTHPPTAFVLLLPVSGFSWSQVAQIWAWLMLLSCVLAVWAYGVPGRWLLALLPLLLWPPLLLSLGQFTPLWLLGLALTWRWRERPFWAGAAIAFASLAKLTPAVLLLPFLVRRQWGALIGFAAAWAFALGVVFALDRGAFGAYFAAQRVMTEKTVNQTDNGAWLPELGRLVGPVGSVLGLVVLASVVLLLLRRRGLDRDSWSAWEWLAAAVLPICWTYSLLPLLPGLLRVRCRWLAAAALLLPLVSGTLWWSAPSILLCLVLAGLAVLLSRIALPPQLTP